VCNYTLMVVMGRHRFHFTPVYKISLSDISDGLLNTPLMWK